MPTNTKFTSRTLTRITIGFVLSLGIYAVFWGVCSSSYFKVLEVHFTGTKRVAKDLLAKSVGVELNKNIFDIDLKTVEHRLANNPWFSSVKVSRKLPGTVSVLVQEREPSFVLLSGNSYYLVSGDGVVLAPANWLPEEGYLLLSGMDSADSRPGVKLFEKYPDLQTIVYTLARKNLIMNSREIKFTKNKGWVLFWGKSSYPVFLGQLDIQASLDKFFRVEQEIEEENKLFVSVDCRFKNMAVVALNKSL